MSDDSDANRRFHLSGVESGEVSLKEGNCLLAMRFLDNLDDVPEGTCVLGLRSERDDEAFLVSVDILEQLGQACLDQAKKLRARAGTPGVTDASSDTDPGGG